MVVSQSFTVIPVPFRRNGSSLTSRESHHMFALQGTAIISYRLFVCISGGLQDNLTVRCSGHRYLHVCRRPIRVRMREAWSR